MKVDHYFEKMIPKLENQYKNRDLFLELKKKYGTQEY
jgi:hypothetical protein